MTTNHNDWDTSAQRSESSSSITSSFDPEIVALKAEMAKINKNLMKVLHINQQVKAVTPNYKTYGGPHSYNDCLATVGQTQNVYAAGAYNQGGNSYQPQGNRNLLSYCSDNYLGPPGGTTKEETKFFQGASHGQNPPPAYQASGYQAPTNMTSLTNSNLELKNMFGQFMKMNTALSLGLGTLPSNTITNPKEDLKGITTRSGNAYQGPMIPTTSSSLPQVVERKTEVIKDTVPPTNNGSTKHVQPLVDQVETPIPNFEPVVTLIVEPVVAPVNALKPNQKPSILYPSRIHDQKLRDKANDQKEKFFQIFQYLNFNISFADALILMPKFGPTIKTLANLGASINLMPLSVWNKLSLPKLSPTCMTFELIDRLISHLVGVIKDVFVKVGTFHFPADFVVVVFDVYPRVPLILERSFLKTEKDLIDAYEGELTLRVGKEVEGLGFSDVITSGNPTPYYDPIISTSSPTLIPFEDSDFLLEEVDAFLSLEAILNDDPSLPPPTQGKYLPQLQKELKICKAKNDKSSINEPPEVELKDLPPHLEYAFLEGDDKFPVIIAKDLSVEEKTTPIKVLKSHNQAIAWKLSDIKGINPEFCTHKILMEDEFKPAVQHQRMVNPKIHDVIKKEVEKLLDIGLIYQISDSPWRVCIDYRKLNEATRKDHFPLPFMDQMLERLARNEYYCFLDGFSGYFQIPIDPKDQEKTTFTCPYGSFVYHRMPFGLCNAPGTFQSHKISKNGIEVDKAKVDVIAKLPHTTTVKECVEAFKKLKRKLTEASILISPDWELPFEFMCDASDFAIGVVLGQCHEKHFRPIHYASKTMTEAESHYTMTKKEMLAMVYAFKKFRSYLILNKSIVYIDHFALKYLFSKKVSKVRLLWWVLLLQEFKFKVINTKGAENLAVDHLSRLENPHQNVLDPKEINETFPLETLNMVSFCGDLSTPWFFNFANYYARNFVVKGMSSQQKKKFFKDVKH
uniref:RNA-directed DNA polymerase n=1 Tax=Tanacetum cinerariifolium TaxID=118510 RepID=A0A699GRS6_TANCI|nr:reverse transcriptase domain-containing protein [Tanacetum cinerariifolium]